MQATPHPGCLKMAKEALMMPKWLMRKKATHAPTLQMGAFSDGLVSEDWLDSEGDPTALPVDMVRDAFMTAIEDLPDTLAANTRARVRRARHRSDLWYLRSELFDLVSRARDQRSAQTRMQELDRYFRRSETGPVPL